MIRDQLLDTWDDHVSRDSTRKQTRHSQTLSGTVIHTYLGVAYHLIGINGACLKKLLSDIKCMTYRYNVNPTSGQGRMELKLFGIPNQSKCGDAIQQLRWQYSRRVKNSRCKLKARIWQPVAEPPRSMHVRVLCWLFSSISIAQKECPVLRSQVLLPTSEMKSSNVHHL